MKDVIGEYKNDRLKWCLINFKPKFKLNIIKNINNRHWHVVTEIKRKLIRVQINK
jgi:hypothetical protein